MGCGKLEKQRESAYSAYARRSLRHPSSRQQEAETVEETKLQREINEIFDKYDINHDDYLERSEVRYMLSSMAVSSKKVVTK
jgi:hypothetical protein